MDPTEDELRERERKYPSREKLTRDRDALLAACKYARHLLHRMGGTNHDPEYTMLVDTIAAAEDPQ